MNPEFASDILKNMAKAIKLSSEPSRAMVLHDLKLLLAAINGSEIAFIRLAIKFKQPEITTFPGDMILTRKPGKIEIFDINKIKNEFSYLLKGSGAEIIDFTQNEIVIHALDISAFRAVETIFDNLEKGLYPSSVLRDVLNQFELSDFISKRVKKREKIEDIEKMLYPPERDPYSYYYGTKEKGDKDK